ncbi:hypothetical protein CALVIDRAFT_472501, partial [Calocera viscosa TUFC12733]
GLNGVETPFWVNLPHFNVCKVLTQDVLHGLHKGFYDHTAQWVMDTVGRPEMDQRIQAVPRLQGMETFPKGISGVSQWTGRKHRALERIILACAVGAEGMTPNATRAARAHLDFIQLARYSSHSTSTLRYLDKAKDLFFTNRWEFVKNQTRQPPHFRAHKLHNLCHWKENIEHLGTMDNYNTETPERYHIEYAKDAYRATNKKHYLPQMTAWLEVQEKLENFNSYLSW